MKFNDNDINEINFSIMDIKTDISHKNEPFIALSKNKYDEIIKHSNGYAYDSLVFRYQKARYANLEQEIKNFKCRGMDDARARHTALNQCERDIIKFCQILDDVIGEHD